MFSFLRKIRRVLVDSGSTRKYILYALGEIALVVIGILIALQINNWNENRNKRARIGIYLNSLIEDLQDDIDEYEFVEEKSIFRYYSTQYLLKLCEEPLYDPSRDQHLVNRWKGNYIWEESIPDKYHKEFIQLAFIWTHRIENKGINTSTIEELKSTGEYSYLNQELKDGLNDYYADWNWRFGTQAHEYTRSIVEQWQGLLMNKGFINSNPFVKEDPIDVLRNDPALIGRLKGLASEASWQSMSAKIIYEKAKKLLNLVEQELIMI